MKKIIFLDIDGALNFHKPHENGYNGIEKRCVANLNYILREVPDALIVISSAWRYMILEDSMTLSGFEYLLLTHGVDCKNRLLGYTEADDKLPIHTDDNYYKWGLEQRVKQIQSYLKKNQEYIWQSRIKYIVIDDLPLDIDNFVKTEPHIGLTHQLAVKAVKILKE